MVWRDTLLSFRNWSRKDIWEEGRSPSTGEETVIIEKSNVLSNPTTGRLVPCTGQAEGKRIGLKRGKRVVIVQKPTKLRLGYRFWPGNETKEHSRSKYGNFSLAPNRQLARAECPGYQAPVSASFAGFCWQFLWLARVVVVELCQHLCASSTVPSALPLRSKGRSRRSQGSKSDALSS